MTFVKVCVTKGQNVINGISIIVKRLLQLDIFSSCDKLRFDIQADDGGVWWSGLITCLLYGDLYE